MENIDHYNFSKTSVERLTEEIKLLQEELFILKKDLEDLRLEMNHIIKPNLTNRSSIGNEGVPTDTPTHTPTVNTPLFPVDDIYSQESNTSRNYPTDIPAHPQHIMKKPQHMTPEIVEDILEKEVRKSKYKTPFKAQFESKADSLADLTGIMNTLKADLKAKFRSLTGQEFYIFSVLYTVEKSQETVTYNDLAQRTGLTSSSIRDYIQRIIRKGIPITKEKMNNKTTLLKVPSELRNLATLDNLMRLRNDIPDESLDRFSGKK